MQEGMSCARIAVPALGENGGCYSVNSKLSNEHVLLLGTAGGYGPSEFGCGEHIIFQAGNNPHPSFLRSQHLSHGEGTLAKLHFFDLIEVQFDRSFATKDIDKNADLFLIGNDFFDFSRVVAERAFDNSDDVVFAVSDLRRLLALL